MERSVKIGWKTSYGVRMSHSALKNRKQTGVARVLARTTGVVVGMLVTSASYATGQVATIQTSEVPATPFVYNADGIEYRWGSGSNQYMEGFTTVDGLVYSYAMSADRVDVIGRLPK